MQPAIMKVGTWPSGCYWLWGSKPLSEYKTDDRIKFKSQSKEDYGLTEWTRGRITGMSGDMPLVERM